MSAKASVSVAKSSSNASPRGRRVMFADEVARDGRATPPSTVSSDGNGERHHFQPQPPQPLGHDKAKNGNSNSNNGGGNGDEDAAGLRRRQRRRRPVAAPGVREVLSEMPVDMAEESLALSRDQIGLVEDTERTERIRVEVAALEAHGALLLGICAAEREERRGRGAHDSHAAAVPSEILTNGVAPKEDVVASEAMPTETSEAPSAAQAVVAESPPVCEEPPATPRETSEVPPVPETPHVPEVPSSTRAVVTGEPSVNENPRVCEEQPAEPTETVEEPSVTESPRVCEELPAALTKASEVPPVSPSPPAARRVTVPDGDGTAQRRPPALRRQMPVLSADALKLLRRVACVLLVMLLTSLLGRRILLRPRVTA